MKKIRRLGLAMIVAVMALSAGGCLVFGGAALGAGTYAYVSGNLKTTYDATMTEASEATEQALVNLNMAAVEENSDAFSAGFTGKMADGRDYSIALTKVTDETTEIAVRVGLGDREVSETIHREIAAILDN